MSASLLGFGLSISKGYTRARRTRLSFNASKEKIMADKTDQAHAFLTDTPIKTGDQDKLGRAAFAENLADQLQVIDDSSSMVIALNAPWGAGKSSLLNLLEERLVSSEGEQATSPIILRFNPWNFATLDQLIVKFFDELGVAVGQKGRVIPQRR